MRHAGWLTCLVTLAALVGLNSVALADPPTTATVHLGHAAVALNGPWRFSTGDDLRWAAPDFDDSHWETVDLTPAPGAHDSDVGLPGYVSGWSLRGHPGYIGYAWYRLRVAVEDEGDTPLVLAGPTDVDTTYQLYVDGKLLGASGVFAGKTPTIYSVQPTAFALPGSSATTRSYLIALRVWMDPGDAGDDSGGIHIAPTLGTKDGIDLLHQAQWLQTFKGYVVDAIEPAAFVLLAVLACGLAACRTRDAYRWLITALLLTAWLRANQVIFFWTHAESLRTYDIVTAVLLVPLALAAWVMAWRDWFGWKPSWLPRVLLIVTLIYMMAALIDRPWFAPEASLAFKAIGHFLVSGIRLIFAALYLWIIGYGVMRQPRWPVWLALAAACLIGIGLFAAELTRIGVPGIWFPYGTGVSRTQYAYAGFIVLLFALLLLRLVDSSRGARRLGC